MTTAAEVGGRLRDTMVKRGVSQKYIAEKMGVTRQTLAARLAGASDFNVSEIAAITDALKLTRDERDEIFFGL